MKLNISTMRISGFCKRMAAVMLCAWLPTVVIAQQSKADDNLLYWAKDRPLTFDDFTARRKETDTIYIRYNKRSNMHQLGVIATAIDVIVKHESKQTLFTIKAVMDKKGSWIGGDDNIVTLKHEQGHFDICEIYARILRREIRKATSLDQSKSIYEEVLAAESSEQAAFDKENTFEQGGITKAWADKIARRLVELQPFSNPVVALSINK